MVAPISYNPTLLSNPDVVDNHPGGCNHLGFDRPRETKYMPAPFEQHLDGQPLWNRLKYGVPEQGR